MSKLKISRSQARQLLLKHQGLLPAYTLQGHAGIMNYIRRVGCIQFDPLNIAGFNHDLVLQARVESYKSDMLRDLLYNQRQLVDGWDKCMSIYPVEDWPYFTRYRKRNRQNPGRDIPPQEVFDFVREQVQSRGPLSSLDIDDDKKINWYWGPTSRARAAMDIMHSWGELVIQNRVHTRRVYDFAHRQLPGEVVSAQDPNSTEEQYHAWHVKRRIGGIGILWDKAGDGWVGTGIKGPQRKQALRRLEEDNAVVPVEVEDIDATFYVRTEDKAQLETPHVGGETSAVFLAPLDNLLWDRKLIEALFEFDYRWEVYKPAKQRQYGYYVLPVLHGDRFVARCEPVYDKKTRELAIKNWWWEPGVKVTEELAAGLSQGMENFVRFHGAQSLVNQSAEKLAWLPLLRPAGK